MICLPSRGPPIDHGNYGHPAYGRLHELGESRGNSRRDSEGVLNIYVACIDEGGQTRNTAGGGAMDTSETLTGTRARAPAAVVGISEGSLGRQEKRFRVGDFRLTFVADED